jgi:hypothetical protein
MRTVELVAGGVAGGSFLVLPLTGRFMSLAARVLMLVLLPALAAAQSSPYPAAQQGTASGSVTAGEAADEGDGPGRVLVVACPARVDDSSAGPSGLAPDSTTQALVAALCARAGSHATAAASLRHLLSTPLDVSNTPRDEAPGAHEARSEHEGRGEHEARGEHEEHADGTPAETAASMEPQFRVHLFGDVRFSAIDSTGARNGFSLGQFDLFGRSQLSDRLSVLTEATLTALPRNSYSARIERLLVTYWPSDHFVASAGRYHASVGYYNTAYHHGSWFQTAVGRPLVFAIDGDIGLLPAHTLGVTTTGDIPSGPFGLRYVAEIGSGRAGQSSAATASQPSLADNNTPSVNVALVMRPERWDGLQLGTSLYRDRLTLQDTTRAPIDEIVGGAYALYKTDAVELLGEWLGVRHRSRADGAANLSRGWYAQASRRFRALRPYVRYDYVNVPSTNQLFAFLGRRTGPTGGVRWDFDALAALKVQASHLQQTTRPTMNRVDAQVSFMF